MGGPLPNALFFTIETLAEKIREKARSQCSIFDGGKVKKKINQCFCFRFLFQNVRTLSQSNKFSL